jgi:trehalose synthase
VLGPEAWDSLGETIDRSRELLSGRVVWNVNSTAQGGGVAELLRSLIAYARGVGIDARWMVIEGDPDFFTITKRIHNRLHGHRGDGGGLGAAERALYEQTLAANAGGLLDLISPGDVVVLHDPQTAGLVAPMRDAGARVVWRCHVGLDHPNELARAAWRFLVPYVRDAEACVFSREAFAWDDLDSKQITVIAPSIDPFSAKNQPLEPAVRDAILSCAGLSDARAGVQPVFVREDGTPGRVDRRAILTEEAPLPAGARVLTQVSRWDRLKDHHGVLRAFVDHVLPQMDAHLVLAGPAVAAVSDDPEGADVLDDLRATWRRLSRRERDHVHLATMPMDDAEENAAIVNALQARSTVIAQKSLAEGFGLTVAEAMWKGRPVVASRVGGIQDQVLDGETGYLVDPADLSGFGREVLRLLESPSRTAELGNAGRERVRERFLGPRHLTDYVDLFDRLVACGKPAETLRISSSLVP